eukprot:318116_1
MAEEDSFVTTSTESDRLYSKQFTLAKECCDRTELVSIQSEINVDLKKTDSKTKTDTLSKQLLYTIHNQQMQQGISVSEHREQIMDILGGIDPLLNVFLKSEYKMNDSQIRQIHQLLVSKSNNISHNNNSAQPQLEDRHDIQLSNLKLRFYDQDMILYKIFNKSKSNFIIKLLTNRIIKVILI